MDNLESKHFRILVADDEYAYLSLFEEVLSLNIGLAFFELVTCDCSYDAVSTVKNSVEQNIPFSVAFLDIRMPPGPDGLWAAEQIRSIDPHIEIVIITAYSDHTPQEIFSHILPAHKLIYMQKPFTIREIHHFAHSLSSKWQHERNWLTINENMEQLIIERTEALTATNKRLACEVSEHKQTAAAFKEGEERLRILSTTLLTVQEKERKKIAMELHDDFGQTLSVLKLNLRHIFNKLQKDQEILKNDCENSILFVNQVLEKIRRLSHGLIPNTLDDLGLCAALKGLIHDFSLHSRTKISCALDNIDDLFPSMTQLIIYRIFQEALVNIHKHSEAEQASVIGRKRKKDVLFMVDDNGKGFNMKIADGKDSNKSGIGLTSMQERVRMLDGRFKISTGLSKGTKIIFSVPFKERSDLQ